jgi:hypothetical protein
MAPELAEWHDFFITTATVAGALIGLLFIAVSLHLPVFNDDRYEDLRIDARSILLGYVIALSLSLFPLIPQSLDALGREVLVVFVFIAVASARSAPRLFRSGGVYGKKNRWFRVALLVTGLGTTLAGGLAFLSGQTWALELMSASVIVLIVVSVLRTWDIVFRAARVVPPR